ncbi:MAG TPA: class I SAM-dependent methyltransferase [Caulobacteraceae bacterium]|nr:class I SAM-dependent methyltransferase [Caulobacteraceae bacterium]
MASLLGDERLEALIDGLQARSLAQEADTRGYFQKQADGGRKDWSMSADDHAHYADKLVALEPAKAEFCYGLCRALGARRIVELGTSFGVSTLYLATAVRDNCQGDSGSGVVIGTEHEPAKAAAARANFAAAGLERWIELREGDLRETLKTLAGPIDFVLFDIWTPMVRPALQLIAPHLRLGAVLCADNTAATPWSRDAYGDYFAYIADPANGLRTMTLPFEGGFEFTVKVS